MLELHELIGVLGLVNSPIGGQEAQSRAYSVLTLQAQHGPWPVGVHEERGS